MKIKNTMLKISLLLMQMVFVSVCLGQTATISPSKIVQGDTAMLVIEYEGGSISPNDLDVTALDKDFDIVGSSSSSRIYNMGGKVVTSMRWELELLALGAGTLEIPSFELKGKATKKLSLIVTPIPAGLANSSAANQDVFLQLSANPESPYVGQQTNILVKLYHRVQIVNGTLSEPDSAQADVYRIGKDIGYSEVVNGTHYEVLERSFAMFPNVQGKMQILPLVFRGQIQAERSDNSKAYDPFMRNVRQISRSSNELHLKVKEIPASFSGKYWLPANDFRLTELWSDNGSQLNVGDAINRDIKIITDGLAAEALPEDMMGSNINNLSIYPDKAVRTNQDIGKKLVGKLEQKYALILSEQGTVQIPALNIKWWDVDEDVEKEAILPARTLTIAGTANTASNVEIQSDKSPGQTSNITEKTMALNRLWQWLAIIFFTLWLITVFLFIKSRTQKVSIQNSQKPAIQWNRKVLRHACNINDATKARNELIAWAQTKWPQDSVIGLHQLGSKVVTIDFKNELNRLDRKLFSDQSGQWSGELLWQAFLAEQAEKTARKTSTGNDLPSLYVQHG